jgi:hypothetical protein
MQLGQIENETIEAHTDEDDALLVMVLRERCTI